jgi:hypothetical protein
MKRTVSLYNPSTNTFKKNGNTYTINLGPYENTLMIPAPKGNLGGDYSLAREIADTLLDLQEEEISLQQAYNQLMAFTTIFACTR